jgi:hypothetical protein
MQAVKPPGCTEEASRGLHNRRPTVLLGDSQVLSQEPSGILVHLHSGQKPPFCPMMHQATRANYPPKGPGRVLPEIKFGGVNVGRRNSVQDSAGRVLPLSDIGPRAALQAPTSSYPRGLERVLPRRGLELSGRPRATPTNTAASRSDGRTAPQDSSRSTTPHPSSSQPQVTGGGCISAIPYRESPPPQGLEGHQRMGTT